MILMIRDWEFDTRELATLPPFVIPTQPEPVRDVLENGDILALAYDHADQNCARLAEALGVRYAVARQALAWYGIWPAEPVPVKPPEEIPPQRRPRFPVLFDGAALRRLYREHGSVVAIAQAIGCNPETVRRHMIDHGITRDGRERKGIAPLAQTIRDGLATEGGNGHKGKQAAVKAIAAVPDNGKMTMARVKLAAYRAYLRNDRCPVGCPGREHCLDGECIAAELMGEETDER